MSQVWKRWIPAAVAGVVVAGAAVAVPLSAGAAGGLPEKSPQDVLAMVAGSSVTAFSGTVEQTSDLGLPTLPTGTGSGSGAAGTGATGSSGSSGSDSSTAAASSALELLTGTHTARVYVDDADGARNLRVQVLDQLAERDVIASGDSVWLYDSSAQTALHATAATASDALPSGPEQTATPQQLAEKFLAAAGSSTDVSVGGDVTVAGRTAYDLVLTPQSGSTLVGAVSIAVDSETGLPLRVEVTAAGASDPAFSSAFSTLDLSTPSADLFAFTPPEGTAVTEKTVPSKPAAADGSAPAPSVGTTDAAKPAVTGTGWSSIVELPAGSQSPGPTASPLLAQLTTPVSGGRLLSTTLLNVFVADDGRVFAGSVPAEALEAAAAQ